MAEGLSCITTVKNRTRQPSVRAQEAQSQSRQIHLGRIREDPNRLYTIEIVEEEDYRVKIHYVGYSSRYDEWIRRSSIVLQAPKPIETEPELSLLRTLACNIKQKLVPSRKEEPLVRIQLPFDTVTFEALKQKGKSLGDSYGHSTYTIRQYSDLNELLGDRWHIRIVNSNGDFSQVLLETIRFYLTRPKPILDFDVERVSNEMKLIPVYVEQGHSLVFTFVRSDGNLRKLKEIL